MQTQSRTDRTETSCPDQLHLHSILQPHRHVPHFFCHKRGKVLMFDRLLENPTEASKLITAFSFPGFFLSATAALTLLHATQQNLMSMLSQTCCAHHLSRSHHCNISQYTCSTVLLLWSFLHTHCNSGMSSDFKFPMLCRIQHFIPQVGLPSTAFILKS